MVGSHVGLTNRQVEALVDRGGLATILVDCDKVSDQFSRQGLIETCVRNAREALGSHDVLVMTSRALHMGADADASLEIGREIAAVVAEIVRSVLPAEPAWLVTKGGVTSHEVLTGGLGLRRAEVVGQLFAGFVSLFRPLEAAEGALEIQCVVFAGNVGDDEALADVVAILRGEPGARAGPEMLEEARPEKGQFRLSPDSACPSTMRRYCGLPNGSWGCHVHSRPRQAGSARRHPNASAP